ncbi:NAD(P)/FAD-dependent oxidoreductase [Lysobacter sp. KIS68-7]|uniref:NAD(P)/FAD-dependent oxidoreductase n=1 Tax=Lysobacter sp. KIS68-7 TaxID=2904252 RepID=UPI001E59D21B|nr:NAD(P)/FAD-dependent oxidoreductase [Lysobacter sp. KIS68-7]UHQ19387.1 NAD(P)/FAD-dependent oxidoreductase [Lysobacter sp. KIS68-7]
MQRTNKHKHRVAIIGGGFGGLAAARKLRGADVDVTLIDRANHHLFQPLLYQVATGILSEGDIAPPLRELLRDQRNARVLFGEVIDIDLEARRLKVTTLDRTSEVRYDSLIVATGSSQSYFGHPEFADDAPGLKTIDDALEVRGRILGAFEMAERENDAAARRRFLTFVVVGAGPTGVELAGQLVELSRRALRNNFRRIDPAEARVVLLDAGPAVLSAFPEALRQRAMLDLEDIGVEVHVDTAVTHVDRNGLETDSKLPSLRRIEAATKVWAAGVQASPLGRMLANAGRFEIDRAGRVHVDADCSLPGHPEVFVVGDLMHLDKLPGVSQVAMQSGRHAADTIRRRLEGDSRHRPFRYRDYGSMATISRFRAVAEIGRSRLAGFPGWMLWLVVHLAALADFKHRLSVFSNWTIGLLGGGRAERVITLQQVFGRHAMSERSGPPNSAGQGAPLKSDRVPTVR